MSNERPSSTTLDALPDELLIQVFGYIAAIGNNWSEEDDPLSLAALPYRQPDLELLPSIGLRGYPFLAQVSRRWRRLLDTPAARTRVWRHMCIDLGHELITAVHAPLRWSNMQPTAAEYADALLRTRVSADKTLRFLELVSPAITSLALANTESFLDEGGNVIRLAGKHDFGSAHLGWALALTRNTLKELCLHRCPDLLSAGGGWALLGRLRGLRALRLEGLREGPGPGQAEALGGLGQLESLTLTGEEYYGDAAGGAYGSGLSAIPDAWSQLTSLTRLELRSHPLLISLPPWLPRLAPLRHLDLSGCVGLGLEPLSGCTQLEVLVLQGLLIGHALPSPAEAVSAMQLGHPPARRPLPDLTPLAPRLRSLSLANNCFTQLPEWLTRLSRLEHLDLSYNKILHIRSPLVGLGALPYIRLLNFRWVHVSADTSFWCEAKCTTMQHLCKLAKALKRRCPQPRLLMDV